MVILMMITMLMEKHRLFEAVDEFQGIPSADDGEG